MTTPERANTASTENSAESVEPLQLVNTVGFAAILGVTRQRVGQLKAEDLLPAPYATVNDEHLVWTKAQAEEFAAERLNR